MELLLMLAGGIVGNRADAAFMQLWGAMVKVIRQDDDLMRAKMESGGLWERLGQSFGVEIQENQAIAQIFESQILVQINAGVKDQQIKLEDLTNITIGTAIGVREILARLDALEARSVVVAVAPSLVVRGGQAIEKLPNPFFPLTGRVDDAGLFFPRSQLVDRVFELLNSGSSVALIGAAESGKSSVLREIERSAVQKLQEPRQAVFLDLSQVAGDQDFYAFLCDEVGVAVCYGTALMKALKSQRLLLLLDEADTIAHDWFTQQIRVQLRGLANEGLLRMVVAAREPLDRAFKDSEKTSPFEGLCTQELVGRWEREMVRRFVVARLKGNKIQFSEGEIDRIVRASEGLPGAVMRECFELYRMREG
jgi:AAA domain